ncbi:hypothetical protein FB451DRAFT_1179914 [Mycena latifolia]|nr:hypothetical protein FB451DRAFT_1179914 [Mycena latifolia]
MTTDIADPPPDYASRHMKEPMKDTTDEKKSTSSGGPEPHYIYYRVYVPDGSIPAKSAFDPANPFRCFANAEKLADPAGSRTVLYLNPAAQAPMDNGAKVAILGPSILNGSTHETAYALVVTEDLTVEERAGLDEIQIGGARGAQPQYLYYQLFAPVGQDTSRVSFTPNETALGRIEKIHICPPHEPATIKRCIAKAEGKPIYAYAELYQDISADVPLISGSYISLMKGTVGSVEDQPMVLVQPERRAGLYNRPIKLLSLPPFSPQYPLSVGKIYYTDGIATFSGYKCLIRNHRYKSPKYEDLPKGIPNSLIAALDLLTPK